MPSVELGAIGNWIDRDAVVVVDRKAARVHRPGQRSTASAHFSHYRIAGGKRGSQTLCESNNALQD